MTRSWLVAAVVGSISLAVACSMAGQPHANSSTVSTVTVETLAQGPVKNLPAGGNFFSILEFHQVPGGDYGPHPHVPAIVYTLRGIASFSFPGASTRSVGAGDAAFFPAGAVYSHENLEGRIGAGAIALGLIVVVILLCAATWLRGGRRRVVIAALLLLLIAGGALPLIGATTNDYYLIAIRQGGGGNGGAGTGPDDVPMPRPDGHNIYASPDFDPVPAAPYVVTLSAITVPAGAHYDAPDVAGPQLIIVLEGTASVHVGGQTQQVGGAGEAFAQAGQVLAIANQTSGTLKVLDFALSPSPASAASPPPGGPVPAQLLGDWLLDTPNPDPGLTEAGIINGKVKLTLTATTYLVQGEPAAAGSVVVNNNEIDFFSQTYGQGGCRLQLPDGVGRYTWILAGGVLHFAPLMRSGYFGDPCGRLVIADQSYIRTH
jgi:quercetin dioxygenase-like cupin family protein